MVSCSVIYTALLSIALLSILYFTNNCLLEVTKEPNAEADIIIVFIVGIIKTVLNTAQS